MEIIDVLVMSQFERYSSFPTGFIVVPLTALGMICDGSKLSSCSPKLRKAAFPATEMSVW